MVSLYPLIHSFHVDRSFEQTAEEFLSRVEITPATDPTAESTEPTEPKAYPELWDAMTAYNTAIYAEGQSGLSDPSAYETPTFDLTDYGLEDEIFGVISIPAMDLEMPIFLGATDSHMAEGAAHLSQTSLPIGGENTNCVIAGHRGWGGASYFRYITELETGDEIIITNHGVIEQMGTPFEIYKSPDTPFVAQFIGRSSVVEAYDKLKGFEKMSISFFLSLF